jgi:hypothetical protein
MSITYSMDYSTAYTQLVQLSGILFFGNKKPLDDQGGTEDIRIADPIMYACPILS